MTGFSRRQIRGTPLIKHRQSPIDVLQFLMQDLAGSQVVPLLLQFRRPQAKQMLGFVWAFEATIEIGRLLIHFQLNVLLCRLVEQTSAFEAASCIGWSLQSFAIQFCSFTIVPSVLKRDRSRLNVTQQFSIDVCGPTVATQTDFPLGQIPVHLCQLNLLQWRNIPRINGTARKQVPQSKFDISTDKLICRRCNSAWSRLTTHWQSEFQTRIRVFLQEIHQPIDLAHASRLINDWFGNHLS